MRFTLVLVRAFRTPELRKKLLFTLGIIAVFRLGQNLPAPGVDVAAVRACTTGSQLTGLSGVVNLLSGGAISKLSVFALGIFPYVTASIILQLLTVVIPRLEALKKEGQAGTTKITQHARYLTVGLAILQATTVVAMAESGRLLTTCQRPLLRDTSLLTVTTIVVCMVAGTTVIMWLGELITEKGIGTGMSILMFTQIVAVFPAEFQGIYQSRHGLVLAAVLAMSVAVVAGVVFVEQAQRRVPVQYAKRMVGRRMYGGTSTYIPLKLNQAGVVPVIFASSLLYLPALAEQIWGRDPYLDHLVKQDDPWYMAVFCLLIVLFTYFYVAITFNPVEIADNMTKYGGFVPGIRPGRATAGYLDHVLSRITAPGAVYIAAIALIPAVAFAVLGASQDFPLGGTSLLIVVGVSLETVKQIESRLQQHTYEGFLR